MTCQRSRGEWHSYVKKALEEAELHEMELHLTHCATCRKVVAEIKEMADLMEGIWVAPGLPGGITQSVMAAIDTSKYRKEKANFSLDYKLWGRSLVAAGLILCFINPFPLAATITELNNKLSWQISQPFDKMDMVTQAAYGKIKSLQFQNIKQVINEEATK